jgi:hypothetical protein
MGANTVITNKTLLSIFAASIFATSLLEFPSVANSEIPTVPYTSGKYKLKSPDWSKINWSSLDAVQQPGYLNISPDIATKLGYNPSRSWTAGQSIDSVIMLGDVDDAFQMSTFSLKTISGIVPLSSKLTLKDLGLMQWQTPNSLIKAIPSLGNLDINQVPVIDDLFAQFHNMSGQISSILKSHPQIANTPFGKKLDLNRYPINSIPRLNQTQLSKFLGWQQSYINQVPGLNQVPFDKMPQPINSGLDVVGIASVVLGNAERGDSRARENYFVSGRVDRANRNVVVACDVGKECSYLELGDVAGKAGNLYGKRWASGSSQKVDGGFGILQRVNGGKEPTGRLVYGSGFKVVLTGVNESTGTANFGLFFRFCINSLWGGKSCTPYFIGPVPWIPTKENDLVILGRG